MTNQENNDKPQLPITPSPPSRLRRQDSWLDKLIPKPTWEDGIKAKITYHANFDWSKSFWHPINGSKTMNILAMKGLNGSKRVAQLWVIGKVEYTTLVVNQFPSYIVKLCLTGDDRNNFCLMLKKWGNLGKDWDLSTIKSIVNFSTRPDKVEELIGLINGNKEVQDIVKTTHYQDTFPFTYNVQKTTNVDADYPDPGHDVNNFKTVQG